jgi:uncharacterized UPF0160 family protein
MASRPTRIGIPTGDFHADIVFSVCVLKHALALTLMEFAPLSPCDPAHYDECDFLLGVGCCYDHSRRRYDHHQPLFCDDPAPALHFPRFTTQMATSGLIYYHFGREALSRMLSDPQHPPRASAPAQLPPEYFEFHYESLYTQFVQEIDGRALEAPQPKQNYEIRTGIWNRIEDLNPHWKTANPDRDAAFRQALALIDNEFAALVRRGRDYGYREYRLTERAYADRFSVDPDTGKIIEFDDFVPCYPYLTKFETDFIRREANATRRGSGPDAIERARVLFMIYNRPTGSWTVRGISSGRGFVQRKKLPAWTPQKVREQTGITDVKFVHHTGLMAIFESRRSALEFAKMAVREPVKGDAQ